MTHGQMGECPGYVTSGSRRILFARRIWCRNLRYKQRWPSKVRRLWQWLEGVRMRTRKDMVAAACTAAGGEHCAASGGSDADASMMEAHLKPFRWQSLFPWVGLGILVLATLLANVDRQVFVLLSAACICRWSVSTATCSQVTSFHGLLAAAIGAGIGEAGIAPVVYGMIPDMFSQARRPLANAIFSTGANLGAGIGIALAGAVVGLVDVVRPLCAGRHTCLGRLAAELPGGRRSRSPDCRPAVVRSHAADRAVTQARGRSRRRGGFSNTSPPTAAPPARSMSPWPPTALAWAAA